MKIITTVITLLIFNAPLAFSSRIPIHEDPEPRVPKRTNAMSEGREIINAHKLQDETVRKRKHIRQNQEETDPIFYDATVSPAEMLESK